LPRKKQSIALIPIDAVQSRILLIRGQRVVLASDLARLYGVSVSRLNQQVGRNAERFPEDFMFQLRKTEMKQLLSSKILKLQFATSSWGGARRALPYAFTEHGAIMAATVLNSPQAVKASLFVVRAFVQLRQLLSTHHQLAAKIDELEHKLQNHDGQILAILNAIRQLMEDPETPAKPPVGFQTELTSAKRAGKKSRLKLSR
jgi:hypothetical protein